MAHEWLKAYRDRQILTGKKKQQVSPVEFDAMCIEFAEDTGDKVLAREWVGLGYVVADEAVAA